MCNLYAKECGCVNFLQPAFKNKSKSVFKSVRCETRMKATCSQTMIPLQMRDTYQQPFIRECYVCDM